MQARHLSHRIVNTSSSRLVIREKNDLIRTVQVPSDRGPQKRGKRFGIFIGELKRRDRRVLLVARNAKHQSVGLSRAPPRDSFWLDFWLDLGLH